MRSNALKHAVWTAAATRTIMEMDRVTAANTGQPNANRKRKALEMTFRHELPFALIDQKYNREQAIAQKQNVLMDRWNDKKGYAIAAGLGSKAFEVTCRTTVQRSYNSKFSTFRTGTYRWAPGSKPRGSQLVHIDDTSAGRKRRAGYGPAEACAPMEAAYKNWRKVWIKEQPVMQTPPRKSLSAYRYAKPKDGVPRICRPIEDPASCGAIFTDGDGCQVCVQF